MDVLSPYPEHRSAVTDTEKLLASGLLGRKAIVIYACEYPKWPALPAIGAFERLAGGRVTLSPRAEAIVSGLVHPIHREARVFGWEIQSRPKQAIAGIG